MSPLENRLFPHRIIFSLIGRGGAWFYLLVEQPDSVSGLLNGCPVVSRGDIWHRHRRKKASPGCRVQPDSHFASAIIDETGSENIFSFFLLRSESQCQPESLLAFSQASETLFITHTIKVKLHQLLFEKQSEGLCSACFTQSVKSSCLLSIFCGAVGCF